MPSRFIYKANRKVEMPAEFGTLFGAVPGSDATANPRADGEER